MDDEVARILGEHGVDPLLAEAADHRRNARENRHEANYLHVDVDPAEALRRSEAAAGYEHHLALGSRQGRALHSPPTGPRNRRVPTGPWLGSGVPVATTIRHSIECLILSAGGGLMIVGWVDDSNDPIDCLQIHGGGWKVLVDADHLIRLRRRDVEGELGGARQHAYGFFGFLSLDAQATDSGPYTIGIWLRSEASVSVPATPQLMGDADLRAVALAHLSGAAFFGNAAVEAVACLDRGFGEGIVRFNKAITARMVSAPYVERFGLPARRLQGSIIVCLYTKAEFLFLQNCLFAGRPGIEDYEFIYVCNSPELAETLLREARSANLAYGLTLTVVILAGNAGFGGANNVAANFARSRRLVALNPDVFPRDQAWAQTHTDLLRANPRERTRLFGIPLYYDDGSLMHGGAYFEVDTGLSLADGVPRPYRMARVEHYGKGAPDRATQYTRSRPVPAVTGAFLSADAAWFENLGGFTEDYVLGHYEDADLCLKSIRAGTAPWLQDLRMWHLEGKGSTRLAQHEGGSLINRWLFSRHWLPMIADGLCGPAPSRMGFETSAPLPAVSDRDAMLPA
jgi:GT2 family glycosyltransferase